MNVGDKFHFQVMTHLTQRSGVETRKPRDEKGETQVRNPNAVQDNISRLHWPPFFWYEPFLDLLFWLSIIYIIYQETGSALQLAVKLLKEYNYNVHDSCPSL